MSKTNQNSTTDNHDDPQATNDSTDSGKPKVVIIGAVADPSV